MSERGRDLGIEAARAAGAGAHADMIETFKGQLLIALVKKLGGKVRIPVSEVDETGRFVLAMRVIDGREFEFSLQEKQ